MPLWYIGSTSVDNIKTGYHGTVKSKKYKDIWNQELKEHPELFKTDIIHTFENRRDALEEEYALQVACDVVKSSNYINESFAKKNGYFGRSVFGKDNHSFGIKHSAERIERNRLSHIGKTLPNKTLEKIRGKNHWAYGKKGTEHPRFGKKESEEITNKKRQRSLGEGNPFFGRRHSPETIEKMRIAALARH